MNENLKKEDKKTLINFLKYIFNNKENAGAFIGLVGVIIGVILGSIVTFWLQNINRITDFKNDAYINLIGLKNPWTQSIQTMEEASVLSDFYNFRYKNISHDPDDLAQAKKENDRYLSLIPSVSNLQMEVFKNIAKVRIAYSLNLKLKSAIDDILNYRTFTTKKPSEDIKTDDDLNKWEDEAQNAVASTVRNEYQNKMEVILPLLLEQLK